MAVLTLIVFIGMLVAFTISSLRGRTLMWGDPIVIWAMGILLLLYSFDLWEDKKELAKRCFWALPFSLLVLVLAKISGFSILISCLSGLLLFYALIIEAKDVKLHYVITLITTLILFCCAFMFKTRVTSLWTLYIISGGGFAGLAFYQSYARKLEQSQKIPSLWPIAFASIKFGVACITAVMLLIISHVLCKQYHLGFAVSFTIAVLIALSFLVLCRVFSIKSPNCPETSKKYSFQNQSGEMENK